MNKKKGLSPVIATVLLIAIVVAMALIIFLWVKGLTEEKITKFGGENIKLSCDKVQISAEYNPDSGILYVSNDGNIPIYSLMIDAISEGDHEAKAITEIAPNDIFIEGSLKQGSTYSGAISLFVDSATSLKVIPILIGNSEEGKKTYVCEDSRSVKEVFY